MKKFFCFIFCVVFAGLSLTFISCSSSEIDKVSKNLTTYAIDAKLDDEKKEISATQTVIFYNNTGEDLDEISFHLYPRAFREDAEIKPYTALTMATCFPNGLSYGDIKVISVKVNGDIKLFETVGEDEDILKVNLGFKLTNKKTVQIVIEFVLTIPNSTHRFGYYNGNINLGNWYPIVCNFENGEFDMTPYYATGDPFCSEIANYSVSLTYPSSYQICSTGKLAFKNNGNSTTAKAEAKAVRDFAMCLSNVSSIVTQNVGGVQVNYMGYTEDDDLSDNLKISSKALEYFGSAFGKYPYSTLSVVKTPFVYGGMEYPNIVYISDSIDEEAEFKKVIVHEIAHQWWYATVGNNEINEAWLDESLAEYSSALFFKNNEEFGVTYDEFVGDALSSYLLYVDVVETIRGDINTKMNLKINEYQNDYEYSYMVYVKGVIMFDCLSDAVGENKLVAGLKKYYKDSKFKIATKEDFYSAFKSACHQDLDNFFEGFLNGTTIISNIS